MNATKVIGIVLIVAGALGLGYGSFTFTKDTHTASIGPLQLSVKEKETVNVPVWAGIAAIIAGGLVLLTGARKG
jgi:multidrug transporter EmrE-like cation transporter